MDNPEAANLVIAAGVTPERFWFIVQSPLSMIILSCDDART